MTEPPLDTVAFAGLREQPLHLKDSVTAWEDYYARIARSLDWDARAIAFKLQVEEDPHVRLFNVLYPREGSSFTDDEAWSLIDRVVDPTRRGALLPHELACDDAPAPFRLGSQLLFRFDRARIELQGDADAKLWKRLEIHA